VTAEINFQKERKKKNGFVEYLRGLLIGKPVDALLEICLMSKFVK